MFGHYLTNKNEDATVAPKSKFRELNKGLSHWNLLVLVEAYSSANSIFLSQQISISRTYQPRNQPTNILIIFLS